MRYDVSGIGSPLLDFIVEVDDKILAKIDLTKGKMHLIDEKQSKEIFNMLSNYTVISAPGGSSANTLAGVVSLGGDSIFLGKIGNDTHADIYEQRSNGNLRLLRHEKKQTGHAITFITPDSERTFATHLGASIHFRKEDVFEQDIKDSKILHLEGFQFENKETNEACVYAMEIARKNNVLISLDLSDSALIDRIHDTLYDIVTEFVDIVFANEQEAFAFTGKYKKDALDDLGKLCKYAIVKLGDKGSLIKYENKVYEFSAKKIDVINTNGAGDMYAAGILYSISKGYDINTAGKIATLASSKIVAQKEARIDKIDLKGEIDGL